MRGKKGQMGGALNLVFVIVFSLAILGVGFLFIQKIFEQDILADQKATALDTNARINSSAPYRLSNATALGFNSPVITGIVNSSGALTISLANATVRSDGVVFNATAAPVEAANITYTYLYGGESYRGVNKTMESFLDIPNLMGLLALVVMIGIVIAVVTGIVPFGRTGTGA